MLKKQKKSKEEKTAEDYFPVDKSDLEHTIEKKELQKEESIKQSVEIPVKKVQQIEEIRKGSIEVKYKKPDRKSLEKVEKISKKKPRKKRVEKTTKTPIKYSHPQIKLKKEGYELILTEKPQAALKIASSLGNSTKRNNKGVPYYEVNRDGKEIIVACAVGHLFTLNQNIAGSSVPIFDISWAPNFIVRKKDFTKKYYDTLLKLVKNAKSLTVATDYDIEGELIGLNVVRFICDQEDANRMKFSTLTSKELNEAYENKLSHINWGHAIAGETRHYLDWFYGINLSRALMNAIKTTGKFKIMSIGRVQGPTLNLIVKKEKEIQKFQPKPYFQVFIKVKNSHVLELKHNKDIFDKQELKKFENFIGKIVKAETRKTEQILPPNPPFNLTTLQTEAYKFFGITPKNTLQIAQSLYLGGLISYPRTSSQKLPSSIDYKTILKKLAKEYNVEKLITKEKPIEGIKTDPAHPSIHPTGEKQILSGSEEKIYNLIVKRFLSLFCDNAIIDNKKVSVTVDNLIFNARGSEIRKKAWLEIYPVKLKENEIPNLNGNVKIINLRTEEKETQPPKRYSPASIITELEKRNLGTKSTRSTILETLYDRNYIKEKSIEATSLGISLISSLEKYSPIIIDEELTRNFEKEMEKIQESEEDFKQKEDRVIDEAKKTITKIAEQFGKNEKKIGQELLVANLQLQEQQKEENKLDICPVCKKGHLLIINMRNKSNFIGCTNYPKCKNTYNLPNNALIKPLKDVCRECEFPKVMVLRQYKKPWMLCINPECPGKEEWKKKSD